MMNRADKLMTMKGADLISLADRLQVKVACNKSRTQLKESKQAVIDRIIIKETENSKEEKKEEKKKAVKPIKEKEAVVSEKKTRKTKSRTEDVSKLLDFIMTEWEKVGNIKINGDTMETNFAALRTSETNRQVLKLMWTKKSVKFYSRSADTETMFEHVKKINYALPYEITIFEFNKETKRSILALFKMAAKDVRKSKKK